MIKSSHTSFKLILCSSPTVLDDQLCYKVDLNNYLTGENVEENLKSGLSLLVDYNEDRQIIPKMEQSQENANFAGKIGIHRNLETLPYVTCFKMFILDKSNLKDQCLIYISTIGRINQALKEKKGWVTNSHNTFNFFY